MIRKDDIEKGLKESFFDYFPTRFLSILQV